MADTRACLQCREMIGRRDLKCKYCGTNQYGENNEFYPDAKAYRNARKLLNAQYQRPKKKRKGLTDEEILATGLYPKNENYKMSLISRILGKK